MDPKQILAVAGLFGAAATATVLTIVTTDEGAAPGVIAGEPAPLSQEAALPASEIRVQSVEQTVRIQRVEDAIDVIAEFPSDSRLAGISESLRSETETYIARLSRAARQQAEGPQWELRVRWRDIAHAGGYVSVLGRASEYRGGAHPADLIDGRLLNVSDGDALEIRQLMKRPWPSPAFTIAVCEALKAAKRERIGQETVLDAPIVCAGPRNNLNLADATLIPAESTEADRFGGLHVLYAPYVVGSYAEGGYDLTIPVDVFADDLTDEYAELFGGKPVPLTP